MRFAIPIASATKNLKPRFNDCALFGSVTRIPVLLLRAKLWAVDRAPLARYEVLPTYARENLLFLVLPLYVLPSESRCCLECNWSDCEVEHAHLANGRCVIGDQKKNPSKRSEPETGRWTQTPCHTY